MEIVKKPESLTLSVRTFSPVGKLSEVMGSVYGEIAGLIAESDTDFAGPPFAVYYNMDMENLDIEIGFPVTKPVETSGRVTVSKLPAVEAATTLYTGSYEGIGKAYDELAAFIGQKGREPETFMWEEYLNSPEEVAPEELQTQICMPLK